LSEILTEHGLCLTYNLAHSTDIYDHEAISADFYHEYFSISSIKQQVSTEQVPRRIKANAELSFSIGAFQHFYDEIFNGRYDGHLFYIHDPYELPTTSSTKIYLQKDTYLKAFVEPQLNAVDESLESLEIHE
jgi:hypothetical protein